jgi:hypothetical protein
MSTCNTLLQNLGLNCPFDVNEIQRVIFQSTFKEDGSKNSIPWASVTTLATWTTLMNKYNFSSDVLEKIVTTPRIYKAASEQPDPDTYDEAGYTKKLRDADWNFSMALNDMPPWLIGQLKTYEDQIISFYLIDAEGAIGGRKVGDFFYPIEIQFGSFVVDNWNLQSFDTPSQSMARWRLKNPKDINSIEFINLTDGDPMSSDFFSLYNATQVITAPAVTGCQTVITLDNYRTAVTGLNDGASDYLNWKFYDIAASAYLAALAAQGSITENPAGTYVVNEAAYLTSGKSYYLDIEATPYDILRATVVVP